MTNVFDLRDSAQLLPGMREARASIGRGEVIVMPTDTVYGVAADAFNPEAVNRLLAAKGRTRATPPPVLVAEVSAFDALAAEVPVVVRELLDRFAPGPLTVILPAQPSLQWDLGDTGGTVALRIPDHELARELLRETGPLAVSSANLHGLPPAATAAEALSQLDGRVSVILDAGEVGGAPSTIIDATGLRSDGSGRVRIVREGALSPAELREVLGEALAHDDSPPEATHA